MRQNPLDLSVLAVNQMFMPMAVVTVKKAIILLARDAAEIVDFDHGKMYCASFASWIDTSFHTYFESPPEDDWIRTPRGAVKTPRVVRLVHCARIPSWEVKFNRKNLLARDNFTCQYCGTSLSHTNFTIDHIVPRSKGGRPTWTNVVSCCFRCNSRKGNQLPQEAGMKLLNTPNIPRRHPHLNGKLEDRRYEVWRYFLQEAH